jgi:hypothetical protein
LDALAFHGIIPLSPCLLQKRKKLFSAHFTRQGLLQASFCSTSVKNHEYQHAHRSQGISALKEALQKIV